MAEYDGTKAARLFGLFGSRTKLAEELGVDKSVVSRWNVHGKRGNYGRVPTHYNMKIMERAQALGLDLHAVSETLDEHTCPCCKRPLEPGMTIDKRYLRQVLAGLEGAGA